MVGDGGRDGGGVSRSFLVVCRPNKFSDLLRINYLFDLKQNIPSKRTCKQHFSTLDWFAGACPWSLHERPLLGEEEVILSLIHKVTACFIAFDQQVRPNGAHQEHGAHEWQSHVLKHLCPGRKQIRRFKLKEHLTRLNMA